MKLALVLLLGAIAVALAGCGGSGDSSGSGTTGADFDRAFIDAMVPHHESAIEMARVAKEAGLTNPDLIKVANDILATQQQEIDRMKRWRKEWFGSSKIDPGGAAALGMSQSQMGMSDDAEALKSSGDVNADFAQMMITHHQAAIEMAKLAASRAGHAELKQLARDIVEAQEREIGVMSPHASGMNHG